MTVFLTLWRRELAAFFLSPIACVTALFFLGVMGFSFWMLATVLIQGPAGVSVMNELFGSIFFWLALLLTAPALTMRLLAEEKRAGTIETLMTAPVTETQVVLAKYAGALAFYCFLWAPTLAYAWVLRRFSAQSMPIDIGPMMGGYLGAFALGAFFLAIGLFCSALTRSQVVAAMLCFALCCGFFLLGFLPYLAPGRLMRDVAGYFSAVSHMLDFSRGAIDTRPLVLYATGSVLMLFAAVRALEARRWT